MSIRDVLEARLTGYAGLTSLVPASRIFAQAELPDGVSYPAVNFHSVSEIRPSCMGSDGGLVMQRIQVNARAAKSSGVSDADAAWLIAEEIRGALQRYRTAGPPRIQDIFLETRIELKEPDAETYNVASDFMVHFEE